MKRLFILLPLICFACKKSNEIINPNHIWTVSELTELNYILSEFDNILKKEYKTSSVEEAYSKYSIVAFENGMTPIFNGMEELISELKTLNVFEKIWWKNSDKKDEYFIKYNDNDYINYLNEIGKTSNLIQDYSNQINSSGDISPSVSSGFSKNVRGIDLADKNNRLIFAIHYLTLLGGR